MQDRVPLYPGRVTLTPVSGNTYDMAMADQPQVVGTPLNKATFLKDATAALFELTSAAVPDDVFAWIGNLNKYWWRRMSISYTITMTDIASGTIGSSTQTMHYASSVDVVDGAITLHSPSTASIAISTAGAQAMVSHAPCYYYMGSNSSVIRYLPSGSTSGTSTSYTVRYYSSQSRLEYGSSASVKAKTCAATASYGSEEYVSASARNAYPDSGESGGYDYEYVGQPLSDMPTHLRCETGSYVGTGTYGESNPNSIEFAFTPKLVLIYSSDMSMFTPYIAGASKFYSGYFSGTTPYLGENTVTLNDKTMSWYGTSAQYQLNKAPTTGFPSFDGTYHYVAIG
jgi:hypothetical protein